MSKGPDFFKAIELWPYLISSQPLRHFFEDSIFVQKIYSQHKIQVKELRPPLTSMSPFYPSTCSCSGLPILLDDYAKSLMLLRKLLGCSMMFVVVSASFDFKVKWKSKKFSSIIQLLKIKSIFHLYRPANLSHQFNLYKPSFSIKAHFLIWSYEACNNNDKLVIENLFLRPFWCQS